MTEPIFTYDEQSDTLYISFVPGVSATGIELNEHILLRMDKQHWQAVGITLFDYSVLAQPTEYGQRSVPLTGLAGLPPDIQRRVLDLLRTAPLNEVLTLSGYTPSQAEMIPITSLRARPLAVA